MMPVCYPTTDRMNLEYFLIKDRCALPVCLVTTDRRYLGDWYVLCRRKVGLDTIYVCRLEWSSGNIQSKDLMPKFLLLIKFILSAYMYCHFMSFCC